MCNETITKLKINEETEIFFPSLFPWKFCIFSSFFEYILDVNNISITECCLIWSLYFSTHLCIMCSYDRSRSRDLPSVALEKKKQRKNEKNRNVTVNGLRHKSISSSFSAFYFFYFCLFSVSLLLFLLSMLARVMLMQSAECVQTKINWFSFVFLEMHLRLLRIQEHLHDSACSYTSSLLFSVAGLSSQHLVFLH